MDDTRSELHRLCAHVLGRRRFEVSGHFGLRASPDGIATPAYGPEPEVLRLAGNLLVREVGSECSTLEVGGSSLTELAAFAGTDLDTPFSAGDDTPPIGDATTPIHLDPAHYDTIVRWFDLGWRVLDRVLSVLTVDHRDYMGDDPVATVQLWPEHFDLGTVIPLATTNTKDNTEKVNVGFSPGDGFSDEPYAYVGPWGDGRPGDPTYWNAPFGAALPLSAVKPSGATAQCTDFVLRGIEFTMKGAT